MPTYIKMRIIRICVLQLTIKVTQCGVGTIDSKNLPRSKTVVSDTILRQRRFLGKSI